MMTKLPAFYSVTLCSEDTIPFGHLYWSLDEAKEACCEDMKAAWDDDVIYDPNRWVVQEWDNTWWYYEGDNSYCIKKTQPTRKL